MLRAGVLAFFLLLPPSGGCRKPAVKNEKELPTVTLQSARGKRQFDDSGKLIAQEDTNRDGQPDLWKIYRRVKTADGKTLDLLDRMELDINYDGKIDIWRFFNDKSELVREEMDLDFDGKIDVVIFYEKGKVVRKELSQGFDEAVKVWKHYEDGHLVRIERVTKTGGKIPDTFELYQEGQIVAVGYDKDGDGKPDVWQKVKEKLKGADGGVAPSPPEASALRAPALPEATPSDGGVAGPAPPVDGGPKPTPTPPGSPPTPTPTPPPPPPTPTAASAADGGAK